jgi:hypothetical protein
MHVVLKLWLLGTVVGVAGALIWAFAPVLVPLLLLTVGLGFLVRAIVALARRLERARDAAAKPAAVPDATRPPDD